MNYWNLIIAAACVLALLVCSYVPESSIEACMAQGMSRENCFDKLAN